VSADASPSFSFSASDNAGGTGVASYECKLDGPGGSTGSWAACSSPRAYSSLADGTYTFSVRAIDQAGNTGSATSRTWDIDTVVPAPSISAGPADGSDSNDTGPSFAFSAVGGTGGIASYECKLDGPGGATGSWAACTSPRAYSSLAEGEYTFRVRAIDNAANTGPATTRTWEIDTTDPGAPSISTGPADGSISSDAGPNFSFSASDNAGGVGVASYECKLDGPAGASGSWEACTSPKAYASLTDGTYAFSVRAVDSAGNTGSATTRAWVVQGAVPDTRLDEPVASYVSADGVTLRFSSDQADATFRCRVDDQAWQACVSPASFALAEGPHTLNVQAVSRAGVTDPNWVNVTVVIDRTAPQTTIERASVAGAVTTDPGFQAQLRASESGARFECQLDGGVWKDCSDTPDYDALPGGEHTFTARSIDRAGNVGAPAPARRWELRGPRRPLDIKQSTTSNALRCASGDLDNVAAISYLWRRDGVTIPGATDSRYELTSADDRTRVTCTAAVTFASGATTRYSTGGVIVMGRARVTDLQAPITLSRAKRLRVSYRSNRTHQVLIRLWCRSRTSTCRPPSRPTDYVQTARASYVPAGLTKYRRILATARQGTNHLDLGRYLPRGLPAGDYKLTIRLAHRQADGRLATSSFLQQEIRVTKP
jgi:hypothetical protein